MLRLSNVVSLSGLLLALLTWGCSGADDADKPAASQLLAADFRLASPSFSEIRPRKRFPIENTCYGSNVSPALEWHAPPSGTKSLALVADEPENELGTWVHWILYNIPADVTELAEGIPTSTAVLPDGTTQGTNDYSSIGYNGPCPPPVLKVFDVWNRQKPVAPPHSYHFRLYALDTEVVLVPGANVAELMGAIEGHILAQAETIGKYTAPVEVQVFDE